MIIREFRKEDLEEIVECARKSFAEEFEVEGFDPDVWRRTVRRVFSVPGRILFGIFRLLRKEPIKFFVADADGKVVGTAMVTARRKIGYIETVMVHPDFRRRGIATELMKTAINYVQKRKFTKAILHVLSINDPAKNLYHKLGFKKFDATVYFAANVDSLPSLAEAEGIQVKDFQKSDIDSVYELIKNSRDLNSLKVYDFQKSDLKNSLWNRIAGMAKVKKIVAFKDEKIVGYASASCASAKLAGRMRNIDVTPDIVSQGIVEELVRVGMEHVKLCGTKTVLATVPLEKEEIGKKLETLGFKKWLVMEGMVLERLNQ